MKTLRKPLAIILAIVSILSLFTVNVLAASFSWKDVDEKFVYAGELKTGTNTFTKTGANAYKFTPSKDGVYAIVFKTVKTSDEYSYSYYYSESVKNGVAYGTRDYVSAEEYDQLYYLNKNETGYYGAVTDKGVKKYEVSVKYLGKITDISIKDKVLQNGMKFYVDETGNKKYTCTINTVVTYKTDKDATFHTDSITAPFPTEKAESKKYTVTVNSLAFSKKISFTVFKASDYIKSIKPSKSYVAPKITVAKDGEIENYEGFEKAYKVTYTFKDGTTAYNAKTENFKVKTPDGRTIELAEGIRKFSDGKYWWYATDGDKEYKIATVTPENAVTPDEPTTGEDTPVKPAGDNIFVKVVQFLINIFKVLMSKLFGI